jgi:WD40 repeat protein
VTGSRLRCFNDYRGSTILTLSVLPHADSPVVVVGGSVSEDAGTPLVAVELWALGTGRLLARCCGTRYQISGCHASFSPTGECVVVAGGLDSTVRMWRVSADVFSSSALDET